MNILKVLGVVVGVHLVAYLVIAQPGCRSTAARPAPARDTAPVVATPVAAEPDFAGELNPGAAELAPIALHLPLAQTPPPAGDRYAPTRPGQAAAEAAPVESTPANTYTVRKGDSFYVIARKHGITVAELTAANNLTPKSVLRPGQKLVVPGKAAVAPAGAASAKAPAAPAQADGSTYTVRSGDTLSKIASRHRTTTKALRILNNISGDHLRIGQVLQLPGDAVATAVPSMPPPPAAAPVAAVRGAEVESNPGVHTVAPGETAESISRKYQISVGELVRANQITDPRKIRIGQVLTIPGAGGALAAPPAPSLVPEAAPATPVDLPVLEQDTSPAPLEEDAPVVPIDEPLSAEPAPLID